MPSGPKKRRAAAKKKEQAVKSTSLPSVELQDAISNQETAPVSNTQVVVINNPVSEDVVFGQCVSPFIEAVEKPGSEMLSVHVESNRDVGSESMGSDLLTSNEPVKNIVDHENDHESDQSDEKAGPEMLASSDLLMNNEQMKNTADDVDLESNQTVAKSGSEKVASGYLTTNEPLKNTADDVDHELNQTLAKLGSEKMASGFLTSNEPVKSIVGEIDHKSNQSDEKAGSELQFSEKSYSMTSIELQDEISNQGTFSESNQTVAKAVSEMPDSVFLTNTNDPVMKTTDQVQGADNDKAGSKMVALNLLLTVVQDHLESDSRPATETIHAIAENTINDGLAMMPDEEASVQLLIEKPSTVQISCDPDTDCYDDDAILNKLISDLRSRSQIKRVKKILEKELMETEKLGLVLKKALDQLALAIHPDEAAA